jgi:hypothetical protein
LLKKFYGINKELEITELFVKEIEKLNSNELLNSFRDYSKKTMESLYKKSQKGETTSNQYYLGVLTTSFYNQFTRYLYSQINVKIKDGKILAEANAIFKNSFPQVSNIDKVGKYLASGDIKYAAKRILEKKLWPHLPAIFKGDLKDISLEKNNNLSLSAHIQFFNIVSQGKTYGNVLLAETNKVKTFFEYRYKQTINQDQLISEFVGPYIGAGADNLNALCFQEGDFINLFPNESSAIVITDQKGTIKIFNKNAVLIGGKKLNLNQGSDLIEFAKTAQKEKLSAFQSHLLINHSEGAVLKETSYEQAHRRVLFITEDQKIGVLNIDPISLNETIRILLSLNLKIKMAVNLDTGYRDFHRVYGKGKMVSLTGYDLTDKPDLGIIKIFNSGSPTGN